MPRLTERWLRATATASSTRARSCGGQAGDVAFDAVDELPDLADLLLGGGGGCVCPFVGAAGGGQPFPGTRQVVEVGGVRQERRCTRAAVVLTAYGNVPPEQAAQVIALK